MEDIYAMSVIYIVNNNIFLHIVECFFINELLLSLSAMPVCNFVGN